MMYANWRITDLYLHQGVCDALIWTTLKPRLLKYLEECKQGLKREDDLRAKRRMKSWRHDEFQG